MLLPPIRTARRLVEPIWGGTRLATWLDLPAPRPTRLGESWQVYDANLIVEGPYAGRSLADLTVEHGLALVGARTVARYGADFPLLVKFLDAADRLSLQVHPNDTYAHNVEAATGFHGKTEAWYILDAAPGASVIYGLARTCTRDEFAAAVADGSVEALMAQLPVVPGDVIFVPAGTLHAISAGIMLFEIQQKSDLTYRAYDYGRLDTHTGQPRALHLERALAVSNLAPAPAGKVVPLRLAPGRDLLIACPYFALERWELAAPMMLATDPGSLEIWTSIAGEAELGWGDEQPGLACGDSLVLPASLGAYELQPTGTATLLRVYVPDLAKLVGEARQAGANEARVAEVIRGQEPEGCDKPAHCPAGL